MYYSRLRSKVVGKVCLLVFGVGVGGFVVRGGVSVSSVFLDELLQMF